MLNWLSSRRPARLAPSGLRARLRVEPALEDRSVPCGSDCVLPEPVSAPVVPAVVAAESADSDVPATQSVGRTASTAGLFAAPAPNQPTATITPPVVVAPFDEPIASPADAFVPRPFAAVADGSPSGHEGTAVADPLPPAADPLVRTGGKR